MEELIPSGAVPEDLGDWQADQPGVYCPRCGASAGKGSVMPAGCPFCLNQRLPWHRLTRLGLYAPPVDAWVRQMKFAGRWRFAEWFGRQLAEAMGEVTDPGRTLVCSVPMPLARRWRRGYNQSDLLGRAVAKSRGLSYLPALKRTRYTPPQTSIVPSRRAENVRQSFALDRVDLSGYEVMLIDDVKTSGATLSACCRLLTKAGAASIHVGVVAVADPKGQAYQYL